MNNDNEVASRHKFRRVLNYFYLSTIAVTPVIMGVYEIIVELDMLFGWGLRFPSEMRVSAFDLNMLILLFLLSLHEHFCCYQRTIIVGVLLMVFFNHFYYATSLIVFLVLSIIATIIIAIGLIGSVIHFTKQIHKFLRYVKTKDKM